MDNYKIILTFIKIFEQMYICECVCTCSCINLGIHLSMYVVIETNFGKIVKKGKIFFENNAGGGGESKT